MVEHPWKAVYDENSRILILGTFPSPKSREAGFYYGHPKNIFWDTLAEVLGKGAPARNMQAMREFLLENRIALWDVLKSCDIKGASDAHIRNPVPNDFSDIFNVANIDIVFTTGKTATRLFNKYCTEYTGFVSEYLPSTSPANCGMHKSEEFVESWKKIRLYLND